MSSTLLADAVLAPGVAVKRRPWRQILVVLAGLAVLLAAAAYAVNYVTLGQYIESTDDAYVGADVTDIAPNVSGQIMQIMVADNQAVRAGDLLIRIDDRDYKAALQKAQAGVAAQLAALTNLDAVRDLQFAMVAQAQADIAAAAAQNVLTTANLARYRRLAAAQAGSVQDAQTAQANFTQSQAAGAKARAVLAAAQAQLAVIATQKNQVQAALAGAQAQWRQAELDVGYTEIRAPFDGVVGNRAAHSGGYATAGAQLISIVPASGLWVDANFKEDQIGHMQAGQAVSITADAAPGVKLHGHVASISPAAGSVFSLLPAENATGNFTKIVQRVPVRITLDGNAAILGLLRPGLSVNADVNTK